MKELIFGRPPVFVGFCNICGLPLLEDGACKKYHKSAVNKEKIGKYSGKSKSVNKFNNYQ